MKFLKNTFNTVIYHFKWLQAHKKRCNFCILSVVISTIIFASVVQYSFTASTTGTATADILSNVAITQNTEMDFATILPSVTITGTVTVPKTADTATCSSGLTCTGTASRGKFDITGEDGSVNISYTDAVVSDGTNTMAVDISSGTINNDTSGTISSGTATLNVGGILSVGANQVAGTYNTSSSGGSGYTVTVNY